MRRIRLLQGILLAALPVVLVAAHNATQVHPSQLLRPLAVVCAVAVVLQGALWSWLRQSQRAALLAGCIAFAVQMWGHLVRLLDGRGVGENASRLVVSAALLGGIGVMLWAAARARRHQEMTTSTASRLFAVTLLVVVVQLGRIAWMHGSAQPSSTQAHAGLQAAPDADATRLPDIYFILLDGYARSDVLQQMYDFDNGSFLQELRRQGFHVADSSAANYVGTLWALASILNLDYLQNLFSIDPAAISMNPLIALVRSNLVVHTLRQAGYRIVTLDGGYSLAEFSNPDVYLQMHGALDEFEQLLLDTTPLPWLFRRQLGPHDMHRRRLQWLFDTLPDLPDSPQPQFVFAHVLAPHPPFVFDATGAAPQRWPALYALNDGSDFMELGGTPEEYRHAYAGQARWVTQQVRHVLQQLLHKHPGRPPVILLLSDHGPGSQLDWYSVENTNLRERFGALCAVYLPGNEALVLPRDLSPVDVFRLVFDLYLGTQLGPLQHHSYFSPKLRPYDFLDVTSEVSGDSSRQP